MSKRTNELTVEQAQAAKLAPPGRFVVAPPRDTDVVQRAVQPMDMSAVQPSLVSDVTATDRAQAFVMETRHLALFVALVAVIVAVAWRDYPLLALPTLLIFCMWYTLVWLLVWLVHRALTPEALAWFNAIMIWWHINRR